MFVIEVGVIKPLSLPVHVSFKDLQFIFGKHNPHIFFLGWWVNNSLAGINNGIAFIHSTTYFHPDAFYINCQVHLFEFLSRSGYFLTYCATLSPFPFLQFLLNKRHALTAIFNYRRYSTRSLLYVLKSICFSVLGVQSHLVYCTYSEHEITDSNLYSTCFFGVLKKSNTTFLHLPLQSAFLICNTFSNKGQKFNVASWKV